MKDRLSKLFTVKSIVTLMLTAVFCYLSVIKVIPYDTYMTVFSVIIAFYFGTQYEKNELKSQDRQ